MSISEIGQNSLSYMYEMQQSASSNMAEKILGELDSDGDGVLSAEEISKAGEHAQNILGADADDDGNVTLDELLADISEKMKNGNMPPPPPPPPVDEEASGNMANNIIDELDTNGDGVLSAEEISKAGVHAQNILGADADGDGNVTSEELSADISAKMKSGGMPPPPPPPPPEDETDSSNGMANGTLDTNDESILNLARLALNNYNNTQTMLGTTEDLGLSLVA